MKVAVIGSRSLQVNDLEKYLPEGTEEIVSGGACGIDVCAREYAVRKRISLTEFLKDTEGRLRSKETSRSLITATLFLLFGTADREAQTM